jgi:hypothetical protein
MTKVICNHAGRHKECPNCGASKLHDHNPFFPEAKCIPFPDAENDDDFLKDDDQGHFDELEDLQEKCGQMPDGGCLYIGTDECDNCPFHKELFN